jgi:hypothetical protein
MANDNKKFRAPKVMVTPSMLAAGLEVMHKCVNAEEENVTDDAMLIGTFLAMWNAYWEEINATHKRKVGASPIIKVPGLILPGQVH